MRTLPNQDELLVELHPGVYSWDGSAPYLIRRKANWELMLDLIRLKASIGDERHPRGVVVDVDARARDLARIADMHRLNNPHMKTPDLPELTRGERARPPVGSAGRIEPVDAKAGRVLGKKVRPRREPSR